MKHIAAIQEYCAKSLSSKVGVSIFQIIVFSIEALILTHSAGINFSRQNLTSIPAL